MRQINIVNLADRLSPKTIAEIKTHFSQEEGEVTLNIKEYDFSSTGNIEDDVDTIIAQIEKDFGQTRTSFQAFIPAKNGAAAHLFAQYEVMMQTTLLVIVDGRLTQVIGW